MKQRMQRGGSIVGFIIACIIGALLLVGGVYALRHVSWFSETSQGPNTQISKTSRGTAPKKSSGNTSSNNQETSGPSNESSKVTPKLTQAQKNNQTSSQNSSDSQSTSTPASEQSNTSVAPDNLPHTGPADIIASLLGVGFLTAATLTYARSRRLV